MKVLKFEQKSQENAKKDQIAKALELMEESTNFILVFSTDDIDSLGLLRYNTSAITAVGMLEIIKTMNIIGDC